MLTRNLQICFCRTVARVRFLFIAKWTLRLFRVKKCCNKSCPGTLSLNYLTLCLCYLNTGEEIRRYRFLWLGTRNRPYLLMFIAVVALLQDWKLLDCQGGGTIMLALPLILKGATRNFQSFASCRLWHTAPNCRQPILVVIFCEIFVDSSPLVVF